MRKSTQFWLLLGLLLSLGFWQKSARSSRKSNTAEIRTGRSASPAKTATQTRAGNRSVASREFDHNRTSYPLRGMSRKGRLHAMPHQSCFQKRKHTLRGLSHADIHRRQFGANCEQCHTVKGWDIRTDQLKQHENRFPLLGAHAMLGVSDCHTSAAVGQFEGLSTACLSCHTADLQRATEPNHKTLNFPTTCETCHSADTWLGAKFDHLKYTGYALTGAHATLDCTACHIGGKYQGTPATCFGCHSKDFNGTTNPPHAQAGFSQQCQLCHNTTTWLNATFDHSTTSFPLIGKHVNVPCNQCHINGNFVGTPTACASCHMTDYNSTNNPPHAQAGFAASACATCHTPAGWDTSTFNHNQFFALTNGHANLQCSQCHTGGNYTTAPTTCAGCHITQYNSTTTPPSRAGWICSNDLLHLSRHDRVDRRQIRPYYADVLPPYGQAHRRRMHYLPFERRL